MAYRRTRWMSPTAAIASMLVAAGCSPGMRSKAAAPPSAADLVSSHDRAVLETLRAERRGDAPPSDNGYRIGPEDLLQIRIPDLLDVGGTARPVPASAVAPVAGTPVFDQGVRVSANGHVRLPMLGLVPAQGRTPTALEGEIGHRLVAAGILRQPQVSVLVAEYRSRVVAVVGSVERPGLYPVTRAGSTVSELLWAAGGPNKDAGRVVEFVPMHGAAMDETHDGIQRVALGDRPKGEPVRLDLQVLSHPSGPDGELLNPPVRPGDVINVPPAGSVMVDGWVQKPGSYPLTRSLTLSGAVTAAGGHVFAADRHRVTLKRVLAPGEERNFDVDLAAISEGRAPDPPVTDGDVVRLPASPVRVVPWGMWTVAKELVRVGGNVLLF